MRLAFGMTYDSTELGNGTFLVGNDIYFDPHADAQVDYETSLFRDTLRLYKFWGDESVGIAEEREAMSQFVDSIYDRKGKPHAMVTFTPKDSAFNSIRGLY